MMPAIVICLAGLLFFSGLAQAGPPLLTSDTGTPGDGHWEINAGLSLERTFSQTKVAFPLLDFNYGLGEKIQLKYEVPWIFSNPDGNEAKSGIGNSILGLKWRFLDEDRLGIAMSVYPQVEFNTAVSSVDKGVVDKGTKFILPFEIDGKIGEVNVTGELGYISNPENDNQWIYGLAFGYQISKHFEWVGEIFGVTSSNFDWATDDLVFNLGFRWKLNQWLNWNTSAGRSLHSVAGNEKTLLFYTGLQFVY
jgi:hypothetical protein